MYHASCKRRDALRNPLPDLVSLHDARSRPLKINHNVQGDNWQESTGQKLRRVFCISRALTIRISAGGRAKTLGGFMIEFWVKAIDYYHKLLNGTIVHLIVGTGITDVFPWSWRLRRQFPGCFTWPSLRQSQARVWIPTSITEFDRGPLDVGSLHSLDDPLAFYSQDRNLEQRSCRHSLWSAIRNPTTPPRALRSWT